MTLTTKAAYLSELGAPLVIESGIEVPKLERGQVLVKVAYSGVCHSQLMEAKGLRGEDAYLPHFLGHEGSGIIQEVGPEVSKVSVGDPVVLGWIKGNGINAVGAKYKKNDKIINSGGVTTFSEYTIASESRVVKLPKGFPLDLAVLMGCALPTGAGIIINTIKPNKDNSIVIWGLGGIGLSALLAVTAYKCKTIIAVDVEDDKLKLAKEIGATHLINSQTESAVDKILEITKGEGVDYCVEAAGRTQTIESSFESVKKNGGLCVFASHPEYGKKIQLDPFDLICGKQIKGSWGGDSQPDRDVPLFIKMYEEGKMPLLRKLISKTYSLDEINDALSDLENRKINRALISIDASLESKK